MARYNEFKNCCALMTWWAFFSRSVKLPQHLLFHIPNQGGGGWAAARRGKQLKAMGVRSGIPDYFLAVARGSGHGLFIEMKTLDGKPSPEQNEAMHNLNAQGYHVAVCHTVDAARCIIEAYLKQK